MVASGFSTSLAAPSARSFYGVFRLRQTLDGTVLCRHFHEQPPYSKRCTQAKRLSTTKGQRKEGLSAESTDMPSAHLAVQVADHEFRPTIVVGHVFAGIGVDGFQILGKEAVEITVQLCHIVGLDDHEEYSVRLSAIPCFPAGIWRRASPPVWPLGDRYRKAAGWQSGYCTGNGAEFGTA